MTFSEIVHDPKSKVCSLGANFELWFGDMDFTPIVTALDDTMVVGPISSEEIVESVDVQQVSLGELYAKLSEANSYVFLVTDINGVDRTVFAYKYGGRYKMTAFPVESTENYYGDVTVISN